MDWLLHVRSALFGAMLAELAMNACHHKIETREHLVRVVKRSVGQNV
jgi:uncharacterized membrane protein YsdA (DUF1294 family)